MNAAVSGSRLYCRACGWHGQAGEGSAPWCPECRMRLRVERPPYACEDCQIQMETASAIGARLRKG